jgi:hypothetical protein
MADGLVLLLAGGTPGGAGETRALPAEHRREAEVDGKDGRRGRFRFKFRFKYLVPRVS